MDKVLKPLKPIFMAYSSDLTDKEWEIFEPLLLQILPNKKRTRPSNWTKREIFNGILYQLKNGCNWCDLPKDFPPYSTVYWHYKQWRAAGVIEELMNVLHQKVRQQVKKTQWTTLIIIDSQAVKNTCNATIALCLDVVRNHAFISMLTHRACKIAIAPKLPAPQLFLHPWTPFEYLSCRN